MAYAPNTYRPLLRPVSFCTLPEDLRDGWEYVEAPAEIAPRRPDIPASAHRFGVIKLARPLTADERERFDMQELG